MENELDGKTEGKKLEILINNSIEMFDKDERFDFNKELLDCLYDRTWCGGHNIDYVNPNVVQAKTKLYVEKYGLPSKIS